MLDEVCRECGSDLGAIECGNGLVWECPSHGVRAWVFDGAPLPFTPRGPERPARRSDLPLPGWSRGGAKRF